jgi:hypothetical protein
MMPTNVSKVASDISWWIPWDFQFPSLSRRLICTIPRELVDCWPDGNTSFPGYSESGLTLPIVARNWRTGVSNMAGGSWRSSLALQAYGDSPFSRDAGWWKGPSHSTYNPLLTSKHLAPMIGLAGLLNLLTLVSRLQAAQQDCPCAPQEAGAPCPSSPPNQRLGPALPPALERSPTQSVGAVATGQSATTLAPARSPRRTAVKRRPAASSQQRGGRA